MPDEGPINENDYCTTHKKAKDIVCLTCAEKICYKCNIKSGHRTHELEDLSDFVKAI